jgi:hypothetical protein
MAQPTDRAPTPPTETATIQPAAPPRASAATAPPKRKSPVALLLGGLAVAASKAKFLLAGVKLLPFGKLALTSLTMVMSIWAYAAIYGFKFALGFVLLILLHELGHGAAMKTVGVDAGWPIFIPFIGAQISLKSMPRSAHDHAVIAYGGPLAGPRRALDAPRSASSRASTTGSPSRRQGSS